MPLVGFAQCQRQTKWNLCQFNWGFGVIWPLTWQSIGCSQWGVEVRVEGGGGKAVEGTCGGPGGDGQSWNRRQDWLEWQTEATIKKKKNNKMTRPNIAWHVITLCSALLQTTTVSKCRWWFPGIIWPLWRRAARTHRSHANVNTDMNLQTQNIS